MVSTSAGVMNEDIKKVYQRIIVYKVVWRCQCGARNVHLSNDVQKLSIKEAPGVRARRGRFYQCRKCGMYTAKWVIEQELEWEE